MISTKKRSSSKVRTMPATMRTLLLASLVALALTLTSMTANAARRAKAGPDFILIQAGELLAVPGQPTQKAKTIVVYKGRISQIRSGFVEADGLELAEGETAEVIDLKEHFVLPGLMDAHVHLMWSGGDHPPMKQEEVTNPDLTLWTLRNARASLMAGFTTVRELAAEPEVIFAVRTWIDAGKFLGPRIIAAGRPVGALGGHGDMSDIGVDPADVAASGLCDGVESCRRAVRVQHKLGSDVIKMMSTGGWHDETGTEQLFFPDEMKATVDTARQLGLKVATHAYADDAIADAVEAGVDSVDHGFGASKSTLSAMKKKGIYLVPTLSIAQKKGKEITLYRDEHRAFETALDVGTPIAFGTDVGGIPHRYAAREFGYMVKLGMPADKAIESATVNTARLFGLESEVGTLVAGKLADIIAVRANPLSDISALENVDFVMKSGRVAKRDGVPADIVLD
jgi:imidazolonepropionase-like amidohydrolase